jgi:hypothetical protein
MSTLGEKQRQFARLIPKLFEKAFELGFEVTLGDGFRDPRVFGAIGVRMGYGHPRSAHKNKLAIDLNLYKDLDGDGKLDYAELTEQHRPLGEWWEKQHPSARWGGRFQDGNHYSFEHEGVM